MSQIEKIVKGLFFPGLVSRYHKLWVLIGTGVIQTGVVILLFSVTSPFRAFVAAAALPCVVPILFAPQLGVYVLAASLIGQWPWEIMRYFGMLVAASTLIWLLLHRKPLFPYNSILVLTGLFTVFVLLSTINPRTRVGLWSFVGHFTLVWIFATLIDSRQALRRVVQLMILSGVVTAVIGLIQARTHFIWPASTTYYEVYFNSSQDKSAIELQSWMGQFRVDSITGTPDFLPLYLQTLMPFVGFWFLRQQNRIRQILGVSILILFGVVHLLSFTRGAILTTGIVLVLMGWKMDKRLFMALGPSLILVGFCMILMWAPARERILSMVTPKRVVEVDAQLEPMKWRLLVLPFGVEMLFERPFLGMGIEQQRYNWPPSARNLIPDLDMPVPLHNSYLQAGIDVGLGGLAVLLALVFTIIRQLQKLGRRFSAIGERELADIASASQIAFIGIACAMLAYPMLESFRYFWLLVSMACALGRLEKELRQTASRLETPLALIDPAAVNLGAGA